MNCIQWRTDGSDPFPSWRDREDYLDRYGARAVLWVGDIRSVHNWGWSPAALCVALRGRLLAGNRGCAVEVGSNDVLVTEAGNGLRLEPTGSGETRVAMLWLPPPTARSRAQDPLPAFFADDAELAVALGRLIHAAQEPGGSMHLCLDLVLNLLAHRQLTLADTLRNCPGRSDRHRRQLYSRLLRAKNLIDHGQAVPLDLAALAEVASLSPSHFLRLFHRVFGASPHRYLVQQRMLRAHRMVVETAVPIGTIAQRLGFINRCAFARLFKQQFGLPATRLRRQASAHLRLGAPRLLQTLGSPSRVAYSPVSNAA
ncbi:helix-turn-helix transcriptional regulator [Tahibacter amnicola]|uniref:AraC family transcriptional regulator n=1 Tax=Tahibacter amnicola TaxID=2976241 RepID=A0ABY6BJH4_9GAMM|nr:AraC family transcriptional regulator [Tahibacter amnicola]UXI69523.1 AraC family transcriptional regulator [Tahibacter amnicola]